MSIFYDNFAPCSSMCFSHAPFIPLFRSQSRHNKDKSHYRDTIAFDASMFGIERRQIFLFIFNFTDNSIGPNMSTIKDYTHCNTMVEVLGGYILVLVW